MRGIFSARSEDARLPPNAHTSCFGHETPHGRLRTTKWLAAAGGSAVVLDMGSRVWKTCRSHRSLGQESTTANQPRQPLVTWHTPNTANRAQP